jgi:hypothetical protein
MTSRIVNLFYIMMLFEIIELKRNFINQKIVVNRDIEKKLC